MEIKEYIPEEFYKIAYEMGFTPRQVHSLRSNRLFPPTRQEGLGRGRGKRYYYTDKSIDELRTLVSWRNQPQARTFQDLRWYLWVFGGWDWIWDDIKKDLLDLFPKVKPEKGDEKVAFTALGNLFSKGRYKLFNGSQLDLWKLVAPNLIRPFVYNHIAKMTIPSLGQIENNEIIPYPEDTDRLLGEGSHNAYQKLIDSDLYSLFLLKQIIQNSSSEDVVKIRPQLQNLEKAWDEDEDLRIMKRILGIRPLRSMGLHRIPRVVSLGLLLLIITRKTKGDA
jgi:hypothetical protein